MGRVRFEWNTWSTGPITGCIIVGSWGLTSALVAVALGLAGSSGPAAFLASVAKGLFLTCGALLVMAMAAGLELERSSVGRARPPKVERAQPVSTRVPAGITSRVVRHTR